MRRKEKINSDTERRWMWLSIVSLAPPDVLNMGQGGWMLYPRNCICSPELIRGNLRIFWWPLFRSRGHHLWDKVGGCYTHEIAFAVRNSLGDLAYFLVAGISL